MLKVVVIRCVSLPNVEKFRGASDPFAKVEFRGWYKKYKLSLTLFFTHTVAFYSYKMLPVSTIDDIWGAWEIINYNISCIKNYKLYETGIINAILILLSSMIL